MAEFVSRMVGQDSEVGNGIFEALSCKRGDTDKEFILDMVDNGVVDVQYTVGPGPNAKHTLLHWACYHANSASLVKGLLDRGADASARELRGRTPWKLADQSRSKGRGAEIGGVFDIIDAATPNELKEPQVRKDDEEEESPAVVLLRLDVKDLETAICRLKESNAYIEKCVKEGDADEEHLSAVVQENMAAIQAKRERIAEKKNEIDNILGLASEKAESRFIDHSVTPSDTLFGLELKYGVSAADIRRANTMTSDRLFAHVKIKIPNPKYKPNPEKESADAERLKMTRRMIAMMKRVGDDALGEAEAKYYLQEHRWDIDAAVAAFRRDEEWAKQRQVRLERDAALAMHASAAVYDESGANRTLEMGPASGHLKSE